jgi:hypothetical protein
VDISFSNTPMIKEEVYQNLPEFIKRIISHYEAGSRQRDVFFTGLLTAFSGCLDDLTGIYRKKRVWSTLYSFILAPAASGKGVLDDVKQVIQPMHEYLSNPAYGFKIRLMIPGDISTAMLLEILKENGGRGILIETEADTIGNTFNKDYGNSMSTKARENFHHETLRVARKTNSEYYEIANPRMSMTMSGTFKQLYDVVPTPENGLFGRFMFYAFEQEDTWDDFDLSDAAVDMNSIMQGYGQHLVDICKNLQEHPRSFSFTQQQLSQFNTAFSGYLSTALASHGSVVGSTVKRMGLIAFRLAMILSAIRSFEEGNNAANLVCADVDFNNAMALADVYLEHAKAALDIMPDDSIGRTEKMREFYSILPQDEFRRDSIIELAKQHSIPTRSMDRWLGVFVTAKKLMQPRRGYYKKP